MAAPAGNIYAFSAPLLDGSMVSLQTFLGRVLLIVNTASQCGFTPQYAGLERLYRTYQDRGFAVLGFPCNQFGRQEPGTGEEIADFCSQRYGVTFPLFARIYVNGPAAHPLYRILKASRPGIFGIQRIQWNFTKFLVDRHGKPVSRHAPKTDPAALSSAIEALLAWP
jgi:glutathione peroxidase